MRFITSDFNKETGVSVVAIEHMGRTFYGIAQLHPEDKAFASTYTGCNYAEMRATIRALQWEKFLLIRQTKEWKNFLNACMSCKNFNKYSKSSKVMFRQYNRKVKRINDLKEEIADIKQELHELIQERNKYIEKKKAEALEKAKEVNVL